MIYLIIDSSAVKIIYTIYWFSCKFRKTQNDNLTHFIAKMTTKKHDIRVERISK